MGLEGTGSIIISLGKESGEEEIEGRLRIDKRTGKHTLYNVSVRLTYTFIKHECGRCE